MTKEWKKIKATAGTSVFKPIASIEHDGELICNTDEIAGTLAARYAEVRSTESHPLNFLTGKDEV